MPVLTEPLMAQGEFLCDFSYDPALNADLAAYRVLQFYWGEELIFAGPILRRTVSRDQITVIGRNPLWYLGSPDNKGPLIDDREYLAGTNKLSNGDFELGTDGGTTNPDGTVATQPTVAFWQLNQSTSWVVLSGTQAHRGTWSAQVVFETSTGDDVLQSSETFDAAPGQIWHLEGWVRRLIIGFGVAAEGHIRLRIVFEGAFTPPNLLGNGNLEQGATGWTSSDGPVSNTSAGSGIANDQANARSGSWVIKMHNGKLSPIFNGGFETGDLTGWVATPAGSFAATNAQHADGSWSAVATGNTGTPKSLQANSNYVAVPGTVSPFPLTAGAYFNVGEVWHLSGMIRAGTGADQPNAASQAFIRFLILDVAYPANNTYVDVAVNSGGDQNAGDWTSVGIDYTVPDNKTGVVPMAVVYGHTSGSWYFDDINLTRLTLNTSTMTAAAITVTPERVYKWQAWIRTGPAFVTGTLKFSVQFFGADRAPVTVTSGPYQGTNNQWQQTTFEIVPPSGMTAMIPSITVTDVAGGYGTAAFYVDDMSITDEDATTAVFDVATSNFEENWIPYAVDVTAPNGTQRARCQVIAENGCLGWNVDDVLFSRLITGWQTRATAGQIVRDCLTNPVAGTPILTIGRVYGDQAILYDIRVKNQTNKALLDHLCKSGLVLPQREYRANPDLTLDWGRDVELFADRTDMVLAPNDFHLLADPAVEQSNEERVNRVKFLGADRQAVNGIKAPLTAEAYNTLTDAVDAFGQPLERVLLSQDSSIDQLPVAVSYAAYQAERNNQPAQAIQVQLADWRAWGRFNVGDWIYLYKPEAGLEDLTRPETTLGDGRVVFPARKRVLSRTWHLGSGTFRVFVVDPANRAQPIDVTDAVRWERDTVAQLDVGDRLPEFAIDPEGGNADVQFLRYRASITR